MPHTRAIGRIALIYQIYFLYIEPLGAILGTYLCLFMPEKYLSGTVPVPAYAALTGASGFKISPLLQMALTNIGALYMLFALQGGILLRMSQEKNIWLAIMTGMLISDVGHVYAVYAIDPKRIFQLLLWNSDEWINYGTLIGGLVLRLFFLAGIGRS